MHSVRPSIIVLLALLLSLLAPAGDGQGATAKTPYTELFYRSGSLRIHAYLYTPYGSGPFPTVIYNHGKREGKERNSVPAPYIGRLLTRAGYVVLVSERRGYGRSDGPTISEELGDDADDKERLVPRLQAETDDVLAALDYLRTLPFADMKRIGIMGWSHGGIITMLATSRSTAFVVAANQAGGARTWNGNPHVRSALMAAAEKTTTPTLLQVAQNDRTTVSITTVAEILRKRGVSHRAVIYPPFTPSRVDPDVPPGHRIFSAEGLPIWEKDLLKFLAPHFKATEPAKPQQ